MKRALALLCVFAVAAVIAEQWDTPPRIADPLGDGSVAPTGRLGSTTTTTNANLLGSVTFQNASSGVISLPGVGGTTITLPSETSTILLPSCSASSDNLIYATNAGFSCSVTPTTTSIITNKALGAGGE